MLEMDYQAWLAGVTADETPAAGGARLFATYGCGQCHGQTAPTLAGLFGRQVRIDDGSTVTADETYLRESILNPASRVVAGYGRLMPSYRGQLNDEQINQLIAYVKSLGVARADAPAPANTDVAAPASRPSNAETPQDLPNVPPARQPPPPRRDSPAEAPR
jgi:cytochrome c oxidase subunit 2